MDRGPDPLKDGEISQQRYNTDEDHNDLHDLLGPSIDRQDIDKVQHQYDHDEGDERTNKSIHLESPSLNNRPKPLLFFEPVSQLFVPVYIALETIRFVPDLEAPPNKNDVKNFGSVGHDEKALLSTSENSQPPASLELFCPASILFRLHGGIHAALRQVEIICRNARPTTLPKAMRNVVSPARKPSGGLGNGEQRRGGGNEVGGSGRGRPSRGSQARRVARLCRRVCVIVQGAKRRREVYRSSGFHGRCTVLVLGPGRFSHSRGRGTFREHPCLAGQVEQKRRTNDAEEIRNRCDHGFARRATRGPSSGNSRRDEAQTALFASPLSISKESGP